MVRRQIRRNKQMIKEPTVEDEISTLPTYERVKLSVLKVIEKSGDYGCTARELGAALPNLDPRRIREATCALKGQGKLKVVTCRCGSTPIYTSV